MSEVSFCKSFLTALDARPIKLSSDHISDARQYPAQGAYTLPRLPHPPHPLRPNPKSSQNASSSSLTVTLKPMKSSHTTVPLSSIDASKTSIYDLKSEYASVSSTPAAKIKILYKKKPIADSKTVAEIIGQDAGSEVEFGVMIMGGAAGGAASSPAAGTPVTSPPAAAPSEAEKGLGGPAAQGPSGKEVVSKEEFWTDLHGFIMQRTRDEAEAERLTKLFRGTWENNK